MLQSYLPKRVLVVSNIPVLPANAGNRERLRTLIEQLQSLGVAVQLLVCGPDPGDSEKTRQLLMGRYTYHPYCLPVPAYPLWLRLASTLSGGNAYFGRLRYLRSIDDIYDPALNEVVKDAAEVFNPGMVITEYVYFSAALECFDDTVVKVIDSHDVLGGRIWRFWRNRCPVNAWTVSRREETRGLNRADLIMAMQEHEAADLRQRTTATVITVGHRVSIKPPARSPCGDAQRILFVGSDNHLNKRGLDRFIRHSLPAVVGRRPSMVFEIAGTICKHMDPGPNIELSGTVIDLSDAYHRADVVVNPVDFGTGLAIKNLQAMGFGKPLVVLGDAARGLAEAEGLAFLRAESFEDLADKLVEVLDNEELAQRLSRESLSFVRNWNSDADVAVQRIVEQIQHEMVKPSEWTGNALEN